MMHLRQWLLAAGLSVTVAAMGCGSDDGNGEDQPDAGAAEPAPDAGPDVSEDAGPAPNIGVWCDPGNNVGENDPTNEACVGGAQCLVFNDTNGMCVVFGCDVDQLGTQGINEESCRVEYGPDYTCVDIDGIAGDDGEINQPREQNTNTGDNVCVPVCVPKDGSNDCESEFACAPAATRFSFPIFWDTVADSVCLTLACQTGEDCPVTVTEDTFCTETGGECPAGQQCVLARDTDGDGTLDRGACAVPGVCNTDNGLCGKHTLGDASASFADPCERDTDCPNGGTCLTEDPVYDDLNRVVSYSPRNGYCTMFGCRFQDTLTEFACPGGYACAQNYFAGACIKNCNPESPTDCRDNNCDFDAVPPVTEGCDLFGDYECVDLTGWGYQGGLPSVAGSPLVCSFAMPQVDCQEMWETRTNNTGCPEIAPAGNPAQMECYLVETGVATTLQDPNGRCLDTTPSGPPCADIGGTGLGEGRFCDGICTDTDGNPCP